MIALTSATRTHVVALFEPSDVEAACELLERECAENLVVSKPSPGSLERIRFAAIRYSGGSLAMLREAVALAYTDWRDLLVGAEFASDVEAHLRWRPVRFDRAVLRQWFDGQRPGGTRFGPGDSVVLNAGPKQGAVGAVVSLVGLEPQPRYEVQWQTGRLTTVWQWMLSRVGVPLAP